MSSYPMRNLNLRNWGRDEGDESPDPNEVDDPEVEAEYRLAEVEAVEMVRDGVWR